MFLDCLVYKMQIVLTENRYVYKMCFTTAIISNCKERLLMISSQHQAARNTCVCCVSLCAYICRSVCSWVCCTLNLFKWILWPQLLIKQKNLFSVLPSSLFSCCFLSILSRCVPGHQDSTERLEFPAIWQFIAGCEQLPEHTRSLFFSPLADRDVISRRELSGSDRIREEKQVGWIVFNQHKMFIL